jgi:hypothetical protein
MTALNAAHIAEQHRSGYPWMKPRTPEWFWNMDNLHGLSIFLPFGEDLALNPPPTGATPTQQSNLRLRDLYRGDELRFVQDTQWKSLIETYYTAVGTPVPPGFTDGPVTTLLPTDVTPPTTTLTLTPAFAPGKVIVMTWVATDTQTGVVGASLVWYNVSSTQWITHSTQMGTSGRFTFTIPQHFGGLAVRAFDKAGNVETITDLGTNVFIVRRIHLPVIKRPSSVSLHERRSQTSGMVNLVAQSAAGAGSTIGRTASPAWIFIRSRIS